MVLYMCSDSLISDLRFQILNATLLTVKMTITFNNEFACFSYLDTDGEWDTLPPKHTLWPLG